MTLETEAFITVIESISKQWVIHRQIAFECGASERLINTINKVVDYCETLMGIAWEKDLKLNYLNQFQNDVSESYNFLIYRQQVNNNFIYGNERHIREDIEAHQVQIEALYTRLTFNLDFFKKLSFFNNNIVAVGANGSGKTSLSNKLKNYIENNGVVVSAQRILLIPNFNSITNPETTFAELKQYQLLDKTNKNPDQFHYLQQEFAIILKNLLAENIALGNNFRREAIDQAKNGFDISKPPITNLDKTIEIWNFFVEHRKIDCTDGMNIHVGSEKGRSYPIGQMSDGEKVMLFLIAQILQAPKDGFIIVDEPEMYLHKTILKKIWDVLEKERQDCIFVYLTHDLDFATSRTTAKKIWIKSFVHPDNWEIEDIPTHELPEQLLLELLGSRKNILFCEGQKGSIDEKIYNILFPHFTITPVGGCSQVISHTKAFNKIPNLLTKAFGLVDTDHHLPERLEAISKHSVFSFSVSEVENLLLDEEFLKVLATNIMVDLELIINIKADIMEELNRHKAIQASNYVSNRIDYYFKDSNVKRGNSLDDVKKNFTMFTEEVKFDDFYNHRIDELDEIISQKDYNKAISIYNNKGLQGIVSRHFRITDFSDRAIKLLQFDNTTHKILLKYFPEKLLQEKPA